MATTFGEDVQNTNAEVITNLLLLLLLLLKSDPPSKKICVTCLIDSPLKLMKNAFCFILKALFVFKIFKCLSRLFGHVGKMT